MPPAVCRPSTENSNSGSLPAEQTFVSLLYLLRIDFNCDPFRPLPSPIIFLRNGGALQMGTSPRTIDR